MGQPARARDRRLGRLALGICVPVALAGCQTVAVSDEVSPIHEPEPAYRRAHLESTTYLEDEIDRLRADLREAEEAMLGLESGMRGNYTRADAVSTLAEARIAVQRAGQRAPWRGASMLEAGDKLDEAERQLQAGHIGTAVFFSTRAKRIADTLNDEAARVEGSATARLVGGHRVNLRREPSTGSGVVSVLNAGTPVFAQYDEGEWTLVVTMAGRVGWIYRSLLTNL